MQNWSVIVELSMSEHLIPFSQSVSKPCQLCGLRDSFVTFHPRCLLALALQGWMLILVAHQVFRFLKATQSNY